MHRQLPHNGPFPLAFRHPARGGPRHGHRQHAQNFGKNRACGLRYPCGKTHTDTHRRGHHNILPPLLLAK